VTEGFGRADPGWEGTVDEGDEGFLPVERFADYAADEGGGCGGGFAGADGDGGEAQGEGVDEASSMGLSAGAL